MATRTNCTYSSKEGVAIANTWLRQSCVKVTPVSKEEGACFVVIAKVQQRIWPVKTEGEEVSPWMPRATTAFAGGNHRLMKRALGAAEGEVAAGGKGAGPVPLEGVNSK